MNTSPPTPRGLGSQRILFLRLANDSRPRANDSYLLPDLSPPKRHMGVPGTICFSIPSSAKANHDPKGLGTGSGENYYPEALGAGNAPQRPPLSAEAG